VQRLKHLDDFVASAVAQAAAEAATALAETVERLALTPTAARCTSALGAKLARARFLANSVKWQYFLHGRWVLSAGAPEEIRTPDPQIRSLMLYAAAQKRSSTMRAHKNKSMHLKRS
jgi:hypothetical protein